MLLQVFRVMEGCIGLAAPVATPLQSMDSRFVVEPLCPSWEWFAAYCAVFEGADIWLEVGENMPPKRECQKRNFQSGLSYLLPLITISHILDSSTVRTFERLSIFQLYPVKNHVRKIRNRPCRGDAVFQTEEGSCRSKNRHPTIICILWRLVRC